MKAGQQLLGEKKMEWLEARRLGGTLGVSI